MMKLLCLLITLSSSSPLTLSSSSFLGSPLSSPLPPYRPPPPPLSMRVSRRGSKLRGQDFSVSRLNEERVSTAGKKGTKNFVDPNRLFAGNLHFMVTTEDLKKWLVEYGLQDKVVECKVITDWRTGASKGYGFVQVRLQGARGAR